MLGLKNRAWRSCIVAQKPPRPSLALLAGGYRRIPILQIGADVFCDSNLIVRVLDELSPAPALQASPDLLSAPISQWFEPRMFSVFSPLRFRTREDVAGSFESDDARAEFVRDRLGFMAPMLDIRKNADIVAQCAVHARQFCRFLDDVLRDGRAYLQGSAPTHADFSAFHPLQWLQGHSAHRDFLTEFERVWAWVDRISALGEGTFTPITEHEAIAMAHAATPSFSFDPQPGPGDPAIGAQVRVAPTDYGVDPVEGVLTSVGPAHVSIARATDETGPLAQHFPRWGYRVDAL